jgi:hypothetical protein
MKLLFCRATSRRLSRPPYSQAELVNQHEKYVGPGLPPLWLLPTLLTLIVRLYVGRLANFWSLSRAEISGPSIA